MTSDGFDGVNGSVSVEEDPEVVVRPLNYVTDEPVVCRIGDRALYIGNRLAAEPDRHDRSFEFEYVLSVTSTEYPLTTHHHPLADGPDNEWATLEAAIDTARELYRRDGSLLVHCKAGISRSSTVLATTLAAEEDRSFVDALALVQRARPHAIPHPKLHEQAVFYLAAQD